MASTEQEQGPAAMVERLRAAVDAHDLDALTDCFAPQYRNETPAHPSRGFVGREQVRRNWAQLFAGVPDVTAQLVRLAVEGDTAWSEWEMRGTRRDGSCHVMAGVTIFGVVDGRADWARFYLEPIEDGDDIDAAIRQAVMPGAADAVGGGS